MVSQLKIRFEADVCLDKLQVWSWFSVSRVWFRVLCFLGVHLPVANYELRYCTNKQYKLLSSWERDNKNRGVYLLMYVYRFLMLRLVGRKSWREGKLKERKIGRIDLPSLEEGNPFFSRLFGRKRRINFLLFDILVIRKEGKVEVLIMHYCRLSLVIPSNYPPTFGGNQLLVDWEGKSFPPLLVSFFFWWITFGFIHFCFLHQTKETWPFAPLFLALLPNGACFFYHLHLYLHTVKQYLKLMVSANN